MKDMDDNKKASTDIPEDKEEKADAVGDEDEDANGENHKELTDEFGFEVPKIAESVAASLDASGQFDPHEASKLTTTMITALRLAESLSLLTKDRKEDLRRELNASVN
jgi:ABC-type Zn2+ transport system substrate-binding protein/surface adhesin